MERTDYEKRKRNAERRMSENAKIETLTAEQHNALAEICRIRHDVHSTNAMSLFFSESQDFKKWEYIDTANVDNKILAIIEEARLPELEWRFNCCDVDDDTVAEFSDKAIDDISEVVESWNRAIESYLEEIDKKHGVNYCPTGAQRIF